MRILVLNPGSATLKYRLLDLAGGRAPGGSRKLADGLIDHVAGDSTTEAAAGVIDRCRDQGIDAVGCRVVHGGERFTAPVLVTPDVVTAIRDLGRLAPLHNPIAAAVLEGVLRRLPGAPLVAVFDTTFHTTIPEVARLYALPLELARGKGLRRYGFHGISYQYVSGRLLECLGRQAAGTRLIVCHLGNGASLCAIRDGKSIDTSMGLTPLEGLVMGTRSGDVDPGLLVHLLRQEGYSSATLDDLLEHKSGLLGLGGSADVRELSKAAASGDQRASLALDIGEHSALLRGRICSGLAGRGSTSAPSPPPWKGSMRSPSLRASASIPPCCAAGSVRASPGWGCA